MNMQRTSAMRLGAMSALCSGLVVATVAVAAPGLPLKASLSSAQVVTPQGKKWTVPAGAKNARAVFTGRLGPDGRTLTWKIAYAHVSGSVIADIHIGKPGKFGAVLGRLCTSCKSGQQGKTKLKRNYSSQFRVSNTWITLITPKYPNGVVRGQITRASQT
jgi:hypothetical protein